MEKKIFVLLMILVPSFACAQNSLEFTASAGYTAIDIDQLVEEDEVEGAYATDWEQFSTGVGGQYFFTSMGNVDVGAELMYQYLYWYSVRIPYGIQPIYREYSVNAIKLTPIFRFGGNNSFVFDVGPELNILDGLKFGLLMSANYYIQVSDNIDIPLKARLDIINNIVITMPVSLNAGIRFRL